MHALIPPVIGCIALVFTREGPTVCAWVAGLLGGGYQAFVWGLCLPCALFLAGLFLRQRPDMLRCACLAACLSLVFIVLSLRVCLNEVFHLLAYGVLGYVAATCPAYGLAGGMLLASAFGVTDELVQAILPQRFFEIRDLIMNVLASASGVICSFLNPQGPSRAANALRAPSAP